MIWVFSCRSDKVRYLNIELIYTYSSSQNNEPEESANSCFICRCILSSRPFRQISIRPGLWRTDHTGLSYTGTVWYKTAKIESESWRVLFCYVEFDCGVNLNDCFCLWGAILHSKICKFVCSPSHQWRIIPVHLWTLSSVCSFTILLWLIAWWVLFGGFI